MEMLCMYGVEVLGSGIYGIKDINVDQIVYIGSTMLSFVSRWGRHVEDVNRNRHCNPSLAKLIKSKKAEFVILESGKFTKEELLERERYYTDKYDVKRKGYNINTGGGCLLDAYICTSTIYNQENAKVIKAKNYIEKKWMNKKIDIASRDEILNHIENKCKIRIESQKFVTVIRKLGFVIHRFGDKKSWMITSVL